MRSRYPRPKRSSRAADAPHSPGRARRKGRNILVFIGDYIDRGSDSKGVIELLLDVPSRYDVHFLRGNHDQSLLDFLVQT